MQITCDINPIRDEDECPIVIHPFIPGIIFANIRNNHRRSSTYIFSSDGSGPVPIRLIATNGFKDTRLKLNIPCDINVRRHFPVPWIAIFNGTDKNLTRSEVISTDGGFSWKKTPSPTFQAVVLNQGGLIFGINSRTKEIYYSFGNDHWYSLKFGSENEDVEVFTHQSGPPTDYVNLITSVRGIGFSKISHVDFSNVFSMCEIDYISDRSCISEDFEIWSIPKELSHGNHRRRILYFRVKPNSFCFVKKSYYHEDI
ncbi:hypothetical protein RF11_16528 [Thelohanellus kitauei]|uniref:Vacuolar protein sorting/targeting protein 10 n=1 Tax=Thelohanellus kitauei TaxID=669202 RepID=A0A0C2MX13_THEKT|nr:hypothetical protein RF11_16528 [Thelohanellus kitauei]